MQEAKEPKGFQDRNAGKTMGINRPLRGELNLTSKARGQDAEITKCARNGGGSFNAGVAALPRSGRHSGGNVSSHDGAGNSMTNAKD